MTPAKSELGVGAPSLAVVLRHVRSNALRLIPQAATEETLISGKTAGARWHMLMEPSMLRYVSETNFRNYPRSDLIKSVLRPAIGNGLFLADGPRWLWQRRAAAPALGRRSIDRLGPCMVQTADQFGRRLAKAGGAPVDVYAAAIGATFDLVSQALFSDMDAVDQQGMEDAFADYVARSIGKSVLQAVGLPKWAVGLVPGADPAKKMHAILEGIIAQRKLDGPLGSPDMLDQLIAVRDPATSESMETADLRDNLLTFMIAGHDTTALTLAWALYLCAFDAGVQDALRDEALRDIASFSDDMTNPKAFAFAEQVLSETLRLYPPAAISSRTAQVDDVVGSLQVGKGDLIVLPTYALHRHRQHWDAPDEFRPERFVAGAQSEQMIYMPFGQGPRSCIGAQMAMTELKVMLATLVSKFRFALVPGQTPEPVLKLTLYPKGGIHLTAVPV